MTKDEQIELRKLIITKEKQIKKAKIKRMIITILGFGILYYILFACFHKPTGTEIISNILAAIFMGGFHFWINSIIFLTLFQKSEAENKHLEYLRKSLAVTEQEIEIP